MSSRHYTSWSSDSEILELFRAGVCIMDEVDWVLHPLKSELNFPIGEKNDLHFTKEGERWRLPTVLFDVLLFAQACEQGAASLVDYAGYVPGMQVTNSGTPGQGTITLRGIAALSGSATVGIYLDDAPVGSSNIYNRANAFAIDLLPYDIERVEVLRGPQGTLYGASSIGGLLKYVTVDPSTDEFSVRGGVEEFGIEGGDGLGDRLRVGGNALDRRRERRQRTHAQARCCARRCGRQGSRGETQRHDVQLFLPAVLTTGIQVPAADARPATTGKLRAKTRQDD